MDYNAKDSSIEFILSQGLLKPKSMRSLICEMMERLGIRFIFWDTSYSIAFAILTGIPILVLSMLAPLYFRFTVAVAAAPTLFLFILAFVEIVERLGSLYELKQTCYYTIQQITALRVIGYSLIGMCYSTVITLFRIESMQEFLSLFTLCLSSLFICAVILLAAMRCYFIKWPGVMFSVLWVLSNLLLFFIFKSTWENFLRNVPLIVTIGIIAISVVLVIWQLRKMLTEEKTYVIT